MFLAGSPPKLGWVRRKAFACWKWSNFLQASGDQAKPLLLINMDETSVRLRPDARKGWAVARGRERKSLLRKGPGKSLAARRSTVTLVSFVRDSDAVQPSLPRVFLSNERVLSKSDVDT